MTDKKHTTQDEQMGEAAADAPETSGQMPQPQEGAPAQSDETGPDALGQRLQQIEATAAQNLDGWQRAVAEFQNYKKRVERDRELDQTAMKGDLIKKVLPVLDDLERALQNRPEESAWTSGIELIQRKLQSILEAEGVIRIEADGALFDPRFHEAISHEPVDGAESGRVVGVAQNGYMIGDRVIRPAMVRVAK